jgi:hypothetical protein
MPKVRFLSLLAAGFLLTGSLVAIAGDRSAERLPAVGSVTRIKTFDVGPYGSCGGDTCSIAFVSFRARTPDAGTMDVVVSISLRYRTSDGDTANAWVSIGPANEHVPLTPRARRLESAPRSVSTTLEWVGRSLIAGGGTVTLEFGLSPVRRSGDTRGSVKSGDVTVVVQMIPR